MSRPLRVGVEWRRQWRRRRTLWAFGLLLALPLVLVAAFAMGSPSSGGTRFVDLARQGSANFALFTLMASGDFLLVVLAALFAGDAVPAEASWSSLRYLLAAPVPRARLISAKLAVALLCTVLAVVLLTGWALTVGGVAYGWGALHLPGGGGMDWPELWPRLALAVGYLAVSLLQICGIALLLGTRTDSPLGATGGAVLVSIVCSILQTVEALGDWRHALPMAYSHAWTPLFTGDIPWTNLERGALWSLLWFGLSVAGAYVSFDRKDVLS